MAKRYPSGSFRILSLHFAKDHFTRSAAKKWAREHEDSYTKKPYRTSRSDEMENFWALRQRDAQKFKNIRTISFGAGIQALIGVPKGTRSNPRKTFKQAQEEIMRALEDAGWEVKRHLRGKPLKVPHATADDGRRVWFKSQAVYLGHENGGLGDARSLHVDIREETPESFLKTVGRRRNPNKSDHAHRARNEEYRARHSDGADKIDALITAATEYGNAYTAARQSGNLAFAADYARKSKSLRKEAYDLMRARQNPVVEEAGDERIAVEDVKSEGLWIRGQSKHSGDVFDRVGKAFVGGKPVAVADVEEAYVRLLTVPVGPEDPDHDIADDSVFVLMDTLSQVGR
jgi:hypothetical protein